ncbi:cuticle protein [Holotrichia oblita]|uniref:Cuticle protein n=1 Tax=Holotrichia oblita TaxID=644536 RepID=A0ACB9SUW2_HOLOL|nr:cuticle protein [Holotrichia oblita]
MLTHLIRWEAFESFLCTPIGCSFCMIDTYLEVFNVFVHFEDCCTVISSLLVAATVAQQYTTPVPILKQINRHNEDGSYSYGYEAADGTFKIESKYPNGEVYGKYGYLDDAGKLREIEYGATRRGFEPAGNDVNVAPPTLHNNYEQLKPLGPNEEDDGQYREDPSIYYKNDLYANTNTKNTETYRPSYQQTSYQQHAYQPDPEYQPAPHKPPSYQQQSYSQSSYQQPSYQQSSYREPSYREPTYQEPSYREPSYQEPSYRPATRFSFDSTNSNQYSGNRHPATNVDYLSGSYSVSY